MTAGERPAAPVAERIPHRREHHGRTFVDDYEWLRDKDSAATRAYLEAENAHTDARTADLAGLRDDVYTEIRSPHGHDAFLIEFEQLGGLLRDWTGALRLLPS